MSWSTLPPWMWLFHCNVGNAFIFSVLNTEFLLHLKARFITTTRPFHSPLHSARFYNVGAAMDIVLLLLPPSSLALPKARTPACCGGSGTDRSELGTPRVCYATLSPNF